MIALGQDKLSDEEIQVRVANGRIPSQNSRDKSYEYPLAVDNYVQKNGQVTKREMPKFKKLRKAVVIRVMQETHCLLASWDTTGSDLMQLGFDLSFITIDETGQLTLAALANVLTSFKHWLAVYLFGDPRQLLLYLISGRANEFKANTETSALALLEEKGYPLLRLIQQYSIAPAIPQFPAKFFYDRLLQNHESVLKDNDLRKKAREISKELYIYRKGLMETALNTGWSTSLTESHECSPTAPPSRILPTLTEWPLWWIKPCSRV